MTRSPVFIRRRAARCVAAALLTCALASAWAMIPVAAADSASEVVSATVASATNLSLTGCSAVGATSLGAVGAGSNAMTPLPCTVTFGSSNDTSYLRIAQSDAGGPGGTNSTAMTSTSVWANVTNPVASTTWWRVRAASASVLYAAGDNGNVIKSTDGGATWASTLTNPTGVRLMGLSVLDANTLFVAGANGEMYRSDDGGDTWSAALPTGTTNQFEQVLATDAQHIYGSGWNSTFVASTDGGATFTVTPLGGASTTSDALAVFPATDTDPMKIIIGRGDGGVQQSTDGGATFSTATVAPTVSYIEEIIVVNDTLAFGACNGGYLIKTTDRGVTWSRSATSTTNSLTGIATRDGKYMEASTQSGEIISSPDGGASWTTKSVGGVFWSLAMPDANRAVAVGVNKVSARSPASPIADYNPGTLDWGTPTTSMFGACLQDLEAATSPGAWTKDANNDCTDTVTTAPTPDDSWYPISTTPTTIAISNSAAKTDASATLRFGMHADQHLAPNVYRADLTFEVIAPV